tara:strand:+ start:5744 stop:6703 length:960 start_codon:yes stop_codon:yes gene_type:complete
MDELLKCKIDGEVFDTEKDLHKHLRKHKIRIAEYYQKYYPRYDKHDGSMIKFKNKDQYLSTEFNSKTNLRMWLKSIPAEEAKEFCKDILITRKEKKNLIYAPSQVELRSIMSPPVQFYNDLFGDYYRLCSQLGYEIKYKKFGDIVSGSEWDSSEYKIFIDTREQKPLRFSRGVEIKTLKYGDYSFSSKEATCNCYIERKSLADLIGTLSGGYERFLNEIERSKEDNANLIILVEAKFNDAMYFNHKVKSYNKDRVYKHVKATPEFIFHKVRKIIQDNPSVQFLFVNGRKEASRVIERIFTCGCAYKTIDLQLAYDLKKI